GLSVAVGGRGWRRGATRQGGPRAAALTGGSLHLNVQRNSGGLGGCWLKCNRPEVAQAGLDEAANAVAEGAYAKATSPMYDESYEADRRGDVEALEMLVELAMKIEQAPDASPGIKANARALVVRLDEVLQAYQEPESEESLTAETGGTSAVHGGSPFAIV